MASQNIWPIRQGAKKGSCQCFIYKSYKLISINVLHNHLKFERDSGSCLDFLRYKM